MNSFAHDISGVRLSGARLLSFDMCFVGVLGCRSFIGWLCGEMVGIGGVGVADAGIECCFIKVFAVGGFEFGLCGFFLCRAEL